MVTRDEVIWGYRLILGREPESEAVIDHHARARDLPALRRTLIESEEFTERYFRMIARGPAGAIDLDTPRIVFLHIPKCGGTTLHHALAACFPRARICPERFNGLGNWPVGMLTGFRLFSGHFDWPSLALIPGRTKKIATLLREPVARLESLYSFLKAHRPEFARSEGMDLVPLAQAHDFADFLEHPEVRRHPSVNNAMARLLSGPLPVKRWEAIPAEIGGDVRTLVDHDPDGALELARSTLASIAAVGTVETLETSVSAIFHALGLPVPETIERRQVLSDISRSDPNLSPVARSPVTPRVREAIEPHIALDTRLYRFACELAERAGQYAGA